MRFRAGEKRKFYRNMQFECSARRLAVVAFALSGLLAPVLLVAFAILGFLNHGAHDHAHAASGLMLVGLGTAPALTAAPNSQANVNALLSRITRDQGPEVEQSLNWANTTQLSTPTSLRTDRKVKFFTLHMRGRITNSAAPGTFRAGPTLLGTPLFSLIQQVTIRGQHLRYGAQVPFQMRGEAIAEYMALTYPNYSPCTSVSVNGGALGKGTALSSAANATNDFDFVLPIPLFPPDIAAGDQPFYCLHGPDWPGNLYMDVQTADATALGVTLAQTVNGSTVTAFGSAAGVGSIEINSERPLISKDFMSKIRPAVLFRTTNFQQPTAAVSGVSGSGLKLADLIVGKDTTRIFVKVGTQLAATTAGIVTFGSLSDTILTRTFFSMDNRNLRFHGPNGDSVMQDYVGRAYGRTIPAGYRMLDFISGTGSSSTANPKSSFSSSKLTSARKFEVDADVTAAANQIAEVTQEILLGRPAMLA
jgi:hypothetical protein